MPAHVAFYLRIFQTPSAAAAYRITHIRRHVGDGEEMFSPLRQPLRLFHIIVTAASLSIEPVSVTPYLSPDAHVRFHRF
jgi:hypothetical protein